MATSKGTKCEVFKFKIQRMDNGQGIIEDAIRMWLDELQKDTTVIIHKVNQSSCFDKTYGKELITVIIFYSEIG